MFYKFITKVISELTKNKGIFESNQARFGVGRGTGSTGPTEGTATLEVRKCVLLAQHIALNLGKYCYRYAYRNHVYRYSPVYPCMSSVNQPSGVWVKGGH